MEEVEVQVGGVQVGQGRGGGVQVRVGGRRGGRVREVQVGGGVQVGQGPVCVCSFFIQL